jgi:Zn-dependent peptidase ImmA (M78 family)
MKGNDFDCGLPSPAGFANAFEMANGIGQGLERRNFQCCYDWLRNVAKGLDACVRESAAVPGDGYVIKNRDDSYDIWLSSRAGLSAGRRNFTLAHEIGHIILERSYRHVESYAARAPSRRKVVERVIDKLAVELLMPERVVLQQLSKHRWENEGQGTTFSQMARTFHSVRRSLGASEAAMLRRLVELPQLASLHFIVTFSRDNFWRSAQPFPCQISRFGVGHCRLQGPWRSIIQDLWLCGMNGVDNYTLQATVGKERLEIECGGWERAVTAFGKKMKQLVILGWQFFNETKI